MRVDTGQTTSGAPPTAKLRVYVEAFTIGPSNMMWGMPHEEYAKIQNRRTAKFLEKRGIYEVVSEADVKAALGDQILYYDSLKGDGWANARLIGRALHADFVLIAARDKNNVGTGEWEFVFISERVDVESIATLGVASIKYTEGQEDEALNRLPEFAKSLVGVK